MFPVVVVVVCDWTEKQDLQGNAYIQHMCKNRIKINKFQTHTHLQCPIRSIFFSEIRYDDPGSRRRNDEDDGFFFAIFFDNIVLLFKNQTHTHTHIHIHVIFFIMRTGRFGSKLSKTKIWTSMKFRPCQQRKNSISSFYMLHMISSMKRFPFYHHHRQNHQIRITNNTRNLFKATKIVNGQNLCSRLFL